MRKRKKKPSQKGSRRHLERHRGTRKRTRSDGIDGSGGGKVDTVVNVSVLSDGHQNRLSFKSHQLHFQKLRVRGKERT